MNYGPYKDWQMPTNAAIFNARTRLRSTVMAQLFAEVAKPLAAPGSSGFYKSWRLVSVDGTCLDIADTPANEKYYGRPCTATAVNRPLQVPETKATQGRLSLP